MSLVSKLVPLVLAGALTTKATAAVYDDFSSGLLNPAKWQIRQDPQGQPLTDEYDVISEKSNFVFHTQQNEIADRRTYLVPTHKFTTGDKLNWEVTVQSREGNYGNIILIRGEEYNRGIFSAVGFNNTVQPFDEIGLTKVNLQFYNDHVEMNTLSPSGQHVTSTLPLQNPEGHYDVYVGTFTGHNGRAHMDFDNFELSVPSPRSLYLLGMGLATMARKRR